MTFLPDTTILGYEAAFQGGLQLDRTGTSVQKLLPTVYFEADSVLYRGFSFDSLGVLQTSPVVYGVADWNAELLFTDGDTASTADPDDSDATNDYDDLFGTRVTATLATNEPDRRVNNWGLFTRSFEWVIMPRNLMYERNR